MSSPAGAAACVANSVNSRAGRRKVAASGVDCCVGRNRSMKEAQQGGRTCSHTRCGGSRYCCAALFSGDPFQCSAGSQGVARGCRPDC
eukprot:152570-Chlamydomonas_euryale.AAC.3